MLKLDRRAAHVIVLIFFSLAVPLFTWASEANPTNFCIQAMTEAKPAAFESPEVIARVTRLAEKLIMSNRAAIEGDYENFNLYIGDNPPIDYKSSDLQSPLFTGQVGELYSHYAFYQFGLSFGQIIGVQSNGRAAFLHATYEYRHRTQVKHYQMVYFDENDEIQSADQGELILQSLSDEFVMSRTMSIAERDLWVAGKRSRRPGLFGSKVHFSPNASLYNPIEKTFQIRMSKTDLLGFYRRGELEVNTYDIRGDWDLTDIRLEFELVFVGDAAITNLMPHMQTQLRNQ